MYELILDELEQTAQDPQPSDDLTLTAMPAVWGNPDSPGFIGTYLVWTTFMGKRIPWHKWALVPLKAVETDIKASGTTYNFYDIQVYNNRFIAGTHIKSNHATATAMDINPKENPYRADNRLVTDIPEVVEQAFKRHGFRLGRDYKTVKDAMHHEYLGPPVKEPEPLPHYENGSRVLVLRTPPMAGTDVRWLQAKLAACDIPVNLDGAYTQTTKKAVITFQKQTFTDPKEWDGICGAKTWSKLLVKETLAQYIDRTVLRQHHTEITGNMVLKVKEWYGVEPLWTLVILGAETSLGDPAGGELVKVHNFGCMKAFKGYQKTKWGMLASGTVDVAGMTWLAFPDAWTGMTAWGRLIKVEYLSLLRTGGVQAAAGKYYGVTVPGYTEYLANIRKLETAFKARLAAYGGVA